MENGGGGWKIIGHRTLNIGSCYSKNNLLFFLVLVLVSLEFFGFREIKISKKSQKEYSITRTINTILQRYVLQYSLKLLSVITQPVLSWTYCSDHLHTGSSLSSVDSRSPSSSPSVLGRLSSYSSNNFTLFSFWGIEIFIAISMIFTRSKLIRFTCCFISCINLFRSALKSSARSAALAVLIPDTSSNPSWASRSLMAASKASCLSIIDGMIIFYQNLNPSIFNLKSYFKIYFISNNSWRWALRSASNLLRRDSNSCNRCRFGRHWRHFKLLALCIDCSLCSNRPTCNRIMNRKST